MNLSSKLIRQYNIHGVRCIRKSRYRCVHHQSMHQIITTALFNSHPSPARMVYHATSNAHASERVDIAVCIINQCTKLLLPRWSILTQVPLEWSTMLHPMQQERCQVAGKCTTNALASRPNRSERELRPINRVVVWESDMSHESRCVKEWFS